jgi:hypothetical protein
VQRRHAEHRHHRVADELLDRAAVPLERRLHSVEVARHHLPERLGIESLAELRRADDVGEDDRHDLPRLARRVRVFESSAAAAAKASVGRVLAAARRTDRHA